jgi:uncharacterized membrane protein YkgB
MKPTALFAATDHAIAQWMARHGLTLLRLSLGLVFLWFGALKLLPSLPLPASEELGVRLLGRFSLGLLTPAAAQILLAVLECAIGLGLLAGRFLRTVIFLLVAQMAGTFAPLFLHPDQVFVRVSYAPTLLGLYIIKNLVLLSAGIVIGATVRGARLQHAPETATPSP